MAIRVIGLDHIVLMVGDVERSLAFYVGVLGLEPERADEWRRGEVLFPSVRVTPTMLIDIFPSDALHDSPSTAHNLDHFCLVIEPTDLDALAASGDVEVASGPTDGLFGAQGYARSLYVRDPDANIVELRSYT